MATIDALPTEILSEVFIIIALIDPLTLHETEGVEAPGWFNITQVCRKWRTVSLSLRSLWAMTWADFPSKMLDWVSRAGDTPLHIRMPYTGAGRRYEEVYIRLPVFLIEHDLARRVKSISLYFTERRLEGWGSVQVNDISHPPKQAWSYLPFPLLEDVKLQWGWLTGGFPQSRLKRFALYYTNAPVSALVDEILRPQKDSLESLVVQSGLLRIPSQDIEANGFSVSAPVELGRMEEMDVFGMLNEVVLLVLSVKLTRNIKTLALLFSDTSDIYEGGFPDFARLVNSLDCIHNRCDVFRVTISRGVRVDHYYFNLEAWFVDDVCPACERAAKLPPNVSITFSLEFDEHGQSPLCPLAEMLYLWIEATRCKDRWADILFLDLSVLCEDAPYTLDWERLEKTEVRWVVPYAQELATGPCDEEEGYSEKDIALLQDMSVLYED